MNIRERVEAFWRGERPDRIPYTIYAYEWQHTADDPAWRAMYADGLGVTFGVGTCAAHTPDVETRRDTWEEGGKRIERTTMRTPVGEVHTTRVNGWHHEFWLKTPEDYRVMTYIAAHTECRPNYQAYFARESAVAPHGVVHVSAGRTPMQTILVDYTGLESFGVHLFEFEDEVMTLYQALLAQYRRRLEIIAEGPGVYVSVLENFTADTMGPARFQRFHVSVYEELFPMLHAAGKIVGTHYDGKLSACRDAIARAPLDMIESLTPPPEGDMTLAECRAAWPEKLFWSNLNVACYNLPPRELKAVVQERAREAAPDGRRLAFEVSEHLPRNWKESMPVVLGALREME